MFRWRPAHVDVGVAHRVNVRKRLKQGLGSETCWETRGTQPHVHSSMRRACENASVWKVAAFLFLLLDFVVRTECPVEWLQHTRTCSYAARCAFNVAICTTCRHWYCRSWLTVVVAMHNWHGASEGCFDVCSAVLVAAPLGGGGASGRCKHPRCSRYSLCCYCIANLYSCMLTVSTTVPNITSTSLCNASIHHLHTCQLGCRVTDDTVS